MEIIGTNQLKKHLAGKRHIRNKTKDDTNVSICDSSFEEELTEVQVDVINDVEKAMASCDISEGIILIPSKPWLQRYCTSCMDRMNSTIEKL